MLLLTAWTNPWHGLSGEPLCVGLYGSLGVAAMALCHLAGFLPRPWPLLRVVGPASVAILLLAVVDLAAHLPRERASWAVFGWPLASAILAGIGSAGADGRAGPLMGIGREGGVQQHSEQHILFGVGSFMTYPEEGCTHWLQPRLHRWPLASGDVDCEAVLSSVAEPWLRESFVR